MRTLRTVLCALVISVAVPAYGTPVGFPADPNGSNCYPFGCTGNGGGFPGTVYQQVYNENNFGNVMTIIGLTFFRTQDSTGPDNLDGGTYNIYLSSTSKAVNGLDLVNFDNNDGPDNTLVFSGSLPAAVAFGSSFTIDTSPFLYDPANGNLLIDMRISGVSHAGSNIYLDARAGTAGTIFSRAQNFGGGYDSFGLVTEFEVVPEPGTVILLLVGLSGLPLVCRVRG
jgi:hypothetical protein